MPKPIGTAAFLRLSAKRQEAVVGRRDIWFGDGWRDTPVYRRAALPAGAVLHGPAIVEQMDSTTVIEPGARAEVDPLGNLIVTIGDEDE
ncbi:MAG: hypothetical protein KA171_14330 [Reyranella sp.]|nr:hypothetical protein [Reyranella sp.]